MWNCQHLYLFIEFDEFSVFIRFFFSFRKNTHLHKTNINNETKLEFIFWYLNDELCICLMFVWTWLANYIVCWILWEDGSFEIITLGSSGSKKRCEIIVWNIAGALGTIRVFCVIVNFCDVIFRKCNNFVVLLWEKSFFYNHSWFWSIFSVRDRLLRRCEKTAILISKKSKISILQSF